MLDDLVGVIETVKERIQNHREALQANETRTRMALIDPLLQVLGWDTADPSLVTPEYRGVAGRPDYALLLPSGKPAAFIEAKKLGESLVATHLNQAMTYSNVSGINYAGLTDGNRWELYEVFKQAPLEERRILDVSIANKPAHETALQLLLLWRPNLESGQPLPASVPILGESGQAAPVSAIQEPTPPYLGQEWLPLSAFVAQTGTKAPAHIRFPDGTQYENKRWQDLVVHTVEWLWKRGVLTTGNVPVQSSAKRYIVNTVPQHPGDNDFKTPRKVAGTGLSVEANISSQAAVGNAKRLLTHCNQHPSQVHLQLAD